MPFVVPAFKMLQTIKRFIKCKSKAPDDAILSIPDQIESWQTANRKMPFMAFADYDVAPHGVNDFCDALQMFCSQGILGLGIGNVDRNYPFFGIPTLRF
ncbi:MAG: hypothetical protein JRF45_15745 [Deltaproteobacteria bacterium]|nr:hypothetical protein [Deltaproteobacteria bacterium]MBW2227758.1 hypothetical protein [Deltaproteobacteria bacterium]MBW2327887.1 hypothetical protein [Deltaproteobacteria bacterium]MBW2556656.1 hypothetical protein [Deltaproteobacteria bacterium]